MPGRAGSFALRRGLALELSGGGLWAAAAFAGWASLRQLDGPALAAGASAVLLLTATGAKRIHAGRCYRRGGAGERQVGRRLKRLEQEGWLVAHDVEKPSGGNVDHLVVSPRAGLFTIETKLNRFGADELEQARKHAEWAAGLFGTPAVALLCIASRASSPRRYAGVWCMGAPRLVRFLRRWQGEPVDLRRVARLLP